MKKTKYYVSQTLEEFQTPLLGVKYFQTLDDLYNKIVVNVPDLPKKMNKEQFFNFIRKKMDKLKTIYSWQNGILKDDENTIYINFPDKKEANKLIKILNQYF